MNASIVGTSVPEQLISVVFDALQALDATINCRIGRRASEDNSPPHAVVAIPLGSPEMDDTHLKPGGAPWGSNAGRQLLIRRFEIEWQCHDGPSAPGLIPDFTNAEALFLNTVVSIRLATDPTGTPFHNGIAFSEEEWIDQQQGADSYERSGTVIKFKTTFELPVYDPPPRLVPLARIVTTVEMNDDIADEVTITQGS